MMQLISHALLNYGFCRKYIWYMYMKCIVTLTFISFEEDYPRINGEKPVRWTPKIKHTKISTLGFCGHHFCIVLECNKTLGDGCWQPVVTSHFGPKMAPDNRLSPAVLDQKWLLTTSHIFTIKWFKIEFHFIDFIMGLTGAGNRPHSQLQFLQNHAELPNFATYSCNFYSQMSCFFPNFCKKGPIPKHLDKALINML